TGRGTHDQLGAHDDLPRRLKSVLDYVNQRFDRFYAELGYRLADSRQRAACHHGNRQVVKANKGDIFRDAQARIACGAHRADRHQVGGGKHGVGLRREKALHGSVAAHLGEVRLGHERAVDVNAVTGEGVQVAVIAIAPDCGVERPGDQADATPPQFEQVADSRLGGAHVVHVNVAHALGVEGSPDDHEWHAGLDQPVDELVANLPGLYKDAVQRSLPRYPGENLLLILFGRDEEQAQCVVMLVARLGDT